MICVTALFLDGRLRHTIWYMYPRYFYHKTDLFHDKYVHPSYLIFCIIVWYILNIKLICIMCIHIVSLMLEMKYIFNSESLIQTCLMRFNIVILNKIEVFGDLLQCWHLLQRIQCAFPLQVDTIKTYYGYNVAKFTYKWWNNITRWFYKM